MLSSWNKDIIIIIIITPNIELLLNKSLLELTYFLNK